MCSLGEINHDAGEGLGFFFFTPLYVTQRLDIWSHKKFFHEGYKYDRAAPRKNRVLYRPMWDMRKLRWQAVQVCAGPVVDEVTRAVEALAQVYRRGGAGSVSLRRFQNDVWDRRISGSAVTKRDVEFLVTRELVMIVYSFLE